MHYYTLAPHIIFSEKHNTFDTDGPPYFDTAGPPYVCIYVHLRMRAACLHL